MKNSGLDILIKTAFTGVETMLIGKKFPINVRALRIVVVELLRTLIGKDAIQEDMISTFQTLPDTSQLADQKSNLCVSNDDVHPC